MSGINATLERLVGQTDGLVVNPFFVPPFSRTRMDQSPGQVANRHPSRWGWDFFGWAPEVSGGIGDAIPTVVTGVGTPAVRKGPTDTDLQVHPFHLSTRRDRGYPGTPIMQTRGRVSGLVQKLKGGRALLGRKIRVYGAYTVTSGDTTTPAATQVGMVGWLKGRVREATAAQTPLSGVDGNATAGGTTFTSSEDFTDVSAGDIVWLSGNGYYQVLSVTAVSPGELEIEGTFRGASVGQEWAIGRGGALPSYATGVQANWVSTRGLSLSHHSTVQVPLAGYVLRVTEPGAAVPEPYDVGEEWMIRPFDDLVRPTNGFNLEAASGADGATSTATLPGDTFTSAGASFLTSIPNTAGTPDQRTFIEIIGDGVYPVDVVDSNTQLSLDTRQATNALAAQDYVIWTDAPLDDSNTSSTVISWGARMPADLPLSEYWQGSVPLPNAGLDPNASVYFLDADEWTDTAVDGNVKVFEDVADEDGAVHYFEQIFEIPETLVLDEDEIYLILMPVDPSDIGSIEFKAEVFWYACQVELIPETGGNVADRLVKSYVSGSRGDSNFFRGYQETDELRRPLMVPVRLPLDFSKLQTFNGADLQHVDRFGSVALGTNDTYTVLKDISTVEPPACFLELPYLPGGSIIESVAFSTLATGTAAGGGTFELWQRLEEPIGWTDGEHMQKIGGDVVATSGELGGTNRFGWTWQPQSSLVGQMYRHRVGHTFPRQSADLPSQLGSGPRYWDQGGKVFILFFPASVSGTWGIHFAGGWIQAWVDVRTAQRLDLGWETVEGPS